MRTNFIIEAIHATIEEERPKTVQELGKLLIKILPLNVPYQIKIIKFLGYTQGIRIDFWESGHKYTLPKQNKVYSIFK